ncbi:GIY-YIG nuclease family protein [Bacillus wiedmannii]|uniref:GIY-YIG nuclease family protein n=1 Tax=Bacillus cereus group TaxID=86661 RepID=UPI0032DF92B5
MRRSVNYEMTVTYGYDNDITTYNISFKRYTKAEKGMIENKAGLYLLLDENENVIYVGESTTLKERIKQHAYSVGNSAKFASLITYIGVYYAPMKKYERLLIEGILVNKLNPEFNINDEIADDDDDELSEGNSYQMYCIDGQQVAVSITQEQFNEIREAIENNNATRKELAAKYGISIQTISHIRKLTRKVFLHWEQERIATTTETAT